MSFENGGNKDIDKFDKIVSLQKSSWIESLFSKYF